MGPNSSGKSTLLRLLSGAYPNFEGSMLVNGLPLSNYENRSVRSNIGILLSMQEIFQGTIKENICIGYETISYERITGLKAFIDSHKEGYAFEIKPIGNHLPDRTAKKILLLRALIHEPQLLLLEEPWLGLEYENAMHIQQFILEQLADKTVVMVTNDEQFAAKCDMVLVMDKGTIKTIKRN